MNGDLLNLILIAALILLVLYYGEDNRRTVRYIVKFIKEMKVIAATPPQPPGTHTFALKTANGVEMQATITETPDVEQAVVKWLEANKLDPAHYDREKHTYLGCPIIKFDAQAPADSPAPAPKSGGLGNTLKKFAMPAAKPAPKKPDPKNEVVKF